MGIYPTNRIEAIHINRNGDVTYDIVHDLVIQRNCSFEDYKEILPFLSSSTVIFDDAIDKKKWKNFQKKYLGGHPEYLNEDNYVLNSKLFPYISNNFEFIRDIVFGTLKRSDAPKEKIAFRRKHIERVVHFSKCLLEQYYHIDKAKLSETERTTLRTLSDCNLEWTVELVGYLHDMYKFSKIGEHGVLAANFFESICIDLGINRNNQVIIQMRRALAIHSDKKLDKQNKHNIVAKILIDSDMLTKYCFDNILEKQKYKYKEGTTLAFVYNDILSLVGEYHPLTPFYKDYRKKELTYLRRDMIREQQEEIFNSKMPT